MCVPVSEPFSPPLGRVGHTGGDGPRLFKGMFVLLCITADQVLHGAAQSELNLPPLLPGWQGQVGRAELSQGVPFCGRMG